ncbi:hypothetical protein OAC88_00255 [Flavobacteriaceae bacterium]|jgi:hypothetical protein|nr:hypothetical protein [Flavobacteriaceae bacterium]
MAYVGKAPQTGAYQILDDIAGSFTGSTAGPFNLTVGGTAVLPGNEQSCIISISGVIQDPAAYTISGSQITFSSNPASSDTFFGTVLGNTFDIGTPTDATVTAGSLATTFFVKNNQTWSSISMSGSNNGALVGPVTVSGTITIPSGSTFVIL